MSRSDKNRARVVLVADRFPAPSETFIAERFRRLLDRGWDMHVVCNESRAEDWDFFPQLAAIPGVRSRVHRRWSVGRGAAILVPLALLRSLLRAPLATVRFVVRGWAEYGPRVFRRLYREAEIVALVPDVVHPVFGTYSLGLEPIKRLVGSRLIVSFQGADLNYAGLDQEPGYYATVWERADGIHFLSEDLLRRAQRRGYTHDDRASLITPGVDTSMFEPQLRPRTDDEPIRILSVGRIHWKKGYDYALDAVHRLVARGVPCVYRVIGGGEDLDAFRYAVHDLQIEAHVEFLGAQPASRVREEMAWADVLLHAATSEGFCYAALEAQAMELPVVTSDADGLPENVGDGVTGFVVARRDSEALANSLMRLAKDPSLREAMGRAGRQRVIAGFTVDREIDAFEALYRQVLGRPA